MPKGLAGFPRAATNFGRMSRPFIAGSWCVPVSTVGYHSTGACAVLSSTTVQCTPLLFDAPVLIGGWYTNVATNVAASTVEVGIYSVLPGGRPDRLLARLGTVDSATTGDKQVALNPTYIPAGDTLAVFYSASAVAMAGYVSGHFGVRLTDPGTFKDNAICGLTFTVGFTKLPERFTGSEVLATSPANGMPFIVVQINKVLPS